MGETSDCSAAYSAAVVPTLGEKKANSQALPSRACWICQDCERCSASQRRLARVRLLSIRLNFFYECNLTRSEYVLSIRAHCPRGGLSPRRGQPVWYPKPCRLAAGGSTSHPVLATASSYLAEPRSSRGKS